MRSGLVLALASLLVALAPVAAQACAVCAGDGGAESRLAYRLTTALLTFLPLLVIGGFVVWIGRRARRVDAARDVPREEPLGRVPSSHW